MYVRTYLLTISSPDILLNNINHELYYLKIYTHTLNVFQECAWSIYLLFM